MKARFLQAIEKRDALNNRLFSETEMRGLSKVEKQFIRNNGYKAHVVQDRVNSLMKGTYYLFIERNRMGKKQLYAYHKKQVLCPNKKDICPNAYNYECWLTFNSNENYWKFDLLNYERRFCILPNTITLIFA